MPGGLICRQLTFSHPGGMVVLDRLEACFPSNAMTLVTGPTGAGKTTLLYLLGGLLRASGGQVLADDRPVSSYRMSHRDRWRRSMGFVFQDLHLIHDLTVLENIVLPLIPQTRTWTQCVRLAGPVLAQLDLTFLAQTRVARLSGGQQQRTAVARAMIHHPRFLLLDEPTAFQDEEHVRNLLAAWAATAARGNCVVVSSHDDRLIRRTDVFSRMWRLDRGRLVPCFRNPEI